MEVKIHFSFALALHGGELSASHSFCIKPGERFRVIQWTGDWVGQHFEGWNNMLPAFGSTWKSSCKLAD